MKAVGLAFAWCAALLVGALGATPTPAWAQGALTITSITPPVGPMSGGTVTLNGTNFTRVSRVVIQGSIPVAHSIVNDSTMTVTLPPRTPGAATVSVIGADPNDNASATYTYLTPPTLGWTANLNVVAGQVVTVRGDHLTDVNSATFGGVTAAFTIVSNTEMTFVVPPGLTAGTHYLQVASPSRGTASRDFTYRIMGVPTVTRISNQEGSVDGGERITIYGAEFTSAAVVRFGSTTSTIDMLSETAIGVIVPPGTGTQQVTVTTAAGVSATHAGTAYTYRSDPLLNWVTPNRGTAAGGATVELAGYNLGAATSVKFGTTSATFTVLSSGRLSVVTPPGTGTVDVVVTTPAGSSAPGTGTKYTYEQFPFITALSPRSSPQGGGAVVQITGSNFVGVTGVFFGSTPAASYTVNSASQVTATAPAGQGYVFVTVRNSFGTSTATNETGFAYDAKPVVTRLTPSSGAIGSAVSVYGGGFGGSPVVKFGGVQASILSNPNEPGRPLFVRVPAGSGQVNVTVEGPGGTSDTSPSTLFTYDPTPVVSNITPAKGPVAGGVSVQISGYSLSGATAVTFGGVAATSFIVDNNSRITAIAPAGAAGDVDVVVTTPNGVSAPRTFTYMAPPTISWIRQQGTQVEISGSNLDSASSVTFGGATATILSNSTGAIFVTPPAGAPGAMVDVVVTTTLGSSTPNAASRYTYPALPTVTSVSPSAAHAGAIVNVFGTNMQHALSVKFGAQDAPIYDKSETVVKVFVPAGVVGATVDVVVTNSAGQSVVSEVSRFTFKGVPTLTSLSPARGAAVGGTLVTIEGAGFLGSPMVKFGEAYATDVTIVSPTRLTAVAPPGQGAVSVRVLMDGLMSQEHANAVFTYADGPSVRSLSPNVGLVGGGATVHIQGERFTPNSAVLFGTTPATSIAYVSPTELTAVSPAGAVGPVKVYVSTDGLVSAPSVNFTYLAGPPVLERLEPSWGPISGGFVSLHGSGFRNVTAVKVGDVTFPITAPLGDTSLQFNMPPGRQAERVSVQLISPVGNSALTEATRYLYGNSPQLTSAAPLISDINGGVAVTFTGYNLADVTGVRFGAIPATSFEIISNTKIVAVAPPGAKGVVGISTESPFGISSSAFSFTYKDQLGIRTETLAAGVAGQRYHQFVEPSEPYFSTMVLESGVLPAGLVIPNVHSDTYIGGTPKAAGSFPITLKLRHVDGREARRSFVLEIAAPTVTISPPTLTNLVQGAAFSQTVVASGGVAPYALAITEGALPAGLSLDPATGVISGTPTAFGPYSFAVTATDSTGGTGPSSTRHLYEGVVEGVRPVAADRAATVEYGQQTPIDLTSSITGQLPDGANIIVQPTHGAVSVNGMVVTYTPTAGYSGPDSFTYSVNGGGKVSNTATVTIQVKRPVITVTGNFPVANQAVDFAGAMVATGGVAPYTFRLNGGAPPSGLTIASDGSITGKPGSSGTFFFSVIVTDSGTGLGGKAEGVFTIVVGVPPAPVAEPKEVTVDIKPTPNGGGSAEIDLSTSVQYASGIQITRQPSHGTLTVDGFKVTYTPTPGYFGQDSFDYVAIPIANNPALNPYRMARAAAAGATVTLNIPAPTLVFGQTTLPNGEEKVAYSQTLTASGGTAPYRFAVTTGALPAGLTLSPAGVLSGVPTVGGSFGFTVTATDSSTGTGPFSVAQAFTLSLKAAVPQVAAPIEASTIQGREVVVDLTAGARGGPFTAAAVVSVTPAGAGEAKIVETGTAAARGYSLAFKSSGTFSGSATVTYTLSNASGVSAPGVVTVKVEARPDPSQDPDVRGIVTAQADAALRMAETQIGNFGRRMESLHSGGSRRFQQGISLGFGFADGGLVDPWTQREIDMNRTFDFSPRAMADMAAADPTKGLAHPRGLMAGGGTGGGGASGSGVAGEGQVSIWTGGSIQFGRRDAKNGGPKFDFTTGGLSLGADLRLSERLAIGVGGGFGQSTADVGSRGSSVEASNYFGVLYASLQPVDGAFIDGMIGYGKLDFDTRRKVSAGVLTPTDVYAVGGRSGDQLILSVSAGWDFRRGDLFISPYARVSSITGTLDAYVERGAGAGNLRYEDQDLSSLKIALGARGERTFKTDLGLLTPRFRVEYQRELKDSELAKLSYDDWVGGPLFSVLADPFERDQWLIGIGGELRRNRSKFSLDYQGNLSSGRDFVSELTGQISFEF